MYSSTDMYLSRYSRCNLSVLNARDIHGKLALAAALKL